MVYISTLLPSRSSSSLCMTYPLQGHSVCVCVRAQGCAIRLFSELEDHHLLFTYQTKFPINTYNSFHIFLNASMLII